MEASEGPLSLAAFRPGWDGNLSINNSHYNEIISLQIYGNRTTLEGTLTTLPIDGAS